MNFNGFTPRIMIVEDETKLADLIAKNLRSEFKADVHIFSDPVEALEFLEYEKIDLVILDIMLPKMDGYSVCRKIKKMRNVPVIMLTALSDSEYIVKGLDMGADDYVTKPFSMDVLMARIRRFFRKRMENLLDFGDLKIYKDEMKVIVKGREVNLTKKEFELLLKFAENPGKVFTRENLMEEIWGDTPDVSDRVVDYTIKRLRKKIEDDPNNPRYIKTVWGVGYKFK